MSSNKNIHSSSLPPHRSAKSDPTLKPPKTTLPGAIFWAPWFLPSVGCGSPIYQATQEFVARSCFAGIRPKWVDSGVSPCHHKSSCQLMLLNPIILKFSASRFWLLLKKKLPDGKCENHQDDIVSAHRATNSIWKIPPFIRSWRNSVGNKTLPVIPSVQSSKNPVEWRGKWNECTAQTCFEPFDRFLVVSTSCTCSISKTRIWMRHRIRVCLPSINHSRIFVQPKRWTTPFYQQDCVYIYIYLQLHNIHISSHFMCFSH